MISQARTAVADYRAGALQAKSCLSVLQLYSASHQKFILKPVTPLLDVCPLGTTWHRTEQLHFPSRQECPRKAEDSNLLLQTNPQSKKLDGVNFLIYLHHQKNTRNKGQHHSSLAPRAESHDPAALAAASL